MEEYMEFFLICMGIAIIGLIAYMLQFATVYLSLSGHPHPPQERELFPLLLFFSPVSI